MNKLFITSLLIFLLIIDSISGQQYLLKKYVVGSSATIIVSPNYKIYNTLGQPAIGKTANINNNLYAGFWKNFNFSTQNIDLKEGWNIISTYINPIKSSMENVWENIKNEVLIVKDNNGNVFIPMYDINTIGNWDPLQAYQVYMNKDATLKIEGALINYLVTPLNLKMGWNLVSYIKKTSMNAEAALVSITKDNSLIIVKNNDGNAFIPEYEINTIGNLYPGQGYQMYLNNNAVLHYPAEREGRGFAINLFPTPKFLKANFTKTGNNQQILVKIQGLNAEFEIGIYNHNNVLIGSGTFRNGISVATIWGDNEKTDITDGAIKNEALNLKLYDIQNGIITEINDFKIINLINNFNEIGLTYQKDELLYVETNSDFNKFDNEIKIKPNPIINNGIINLNLKYSGFIEMNLFTIEGKLIRQFANGSFTKGDYNFEFSKGILASGEYNIVLKTGDIIITKKLMITD